MKTAKALRAGRKRPSGRSRSVPTRPAVTFHSKSPPGAGSRLRRVVRAHDRDERGRSQHVSGEHQQLSPGSPDDVFAWFAGYRISSSLSGASSPPSPTSTPSRASTRPSPRRPPAMTASSTWRLTPTTRGRSSTARACGTRMGGRRRRLDEFVELCKDMQGAGITLASPVRTRTAGRRWAPSTSSTCAPTDTTSTSPMAGEEAWDSTEVKTVFETRAT